LKGEYETIREAGAQVVAVSTDDLAAHERFCQELGGCPFPLVSDPELVAARLYGVVGEDGRRSHRAVFVIDRGGAILHQITWFQPGNIGQFLEIFEALGAV
jgi:peroxiredoxin